MPAKKRKHVDASCPPGRRRTPNATADVASRRLVAGQGSILSFFGPASSPSPRAPSVSSTMSPAPRRRSNAVPPTGSAFKRARTAQPVSSSRSPKGKARASPQYQEGIIDLCSDPDDDVFALPFAISNAPATIPLEGEDFVRPPELEEGEDDDLWEVDTATVGGQSSSGSYFGAGGGRGICPLCGVKLTGMGINNAATHVNECLDSNGESADRLQAASGDRTNTIASSFATEIPTDHSSASKCKPLQYLPSPGSKFASGAHSYRKPNAFTALMTGHVEGKAWKGVEKDHIRARLPSGAKREAPFYKVMDGMPIAVDAFRYGKIPGVRAYFLSHAHADHYTNLSGSWDHGPVYCSTTTANLIVHNLGVKENWVRRLPNDTPTVVEGVTVTLLDANHCPGSSLFLFEGPHTSPSSPWSKTPTRIFRYLHCGDFRASPAHLRHPALEGKRIDICYLDTTYLDPKYCFPAQGQVINACAELVTQRIQGDEGALRRGRDGDEQRAERMIKGWLAAGVAKEESERDSRGASHQTVATDAPALVRVDSARCRAGNEDEEGEWVGGSAAPFDHMNEEKMLWEASKTEPDKAEPGAAAGAIEGPLPSIEDKAKIMAGQSASVAKTSTALDSTSGSKPVERFCVLVGTYSIGKERIVKAIARALGSRIYCNERKSAIWRCIDDPELHAMMTGDPKDAQVHVTNLFAIKRETLEDYLNRFGGHFTKIIGLRPTGWTFRSERKEEKMPSISKTLAFDSKRGFSPAYLYPQRDSTNKCQAYGVPYSEHSSFYELTCFCLSFDWVRMIPTVNCGNPSSRAKMQVWFDRWRAERKRRKEAGEPTFIEPRTSNYW